MKLKVLVGLTHECPTEEHVEVHAVGGYPLKAADPDDSYDACVEIPDEEALSEWAERRYEVRRIAEVEVPGEHLALPVYKTIDRAERMTQEEAMAFQGNDPVAGSEFREMATLFLQMHGLVQDLLDRAGLCAALGSSPPEEVRIVQARSQALVDNTRNVTRPWRT